MKKLLLILGLLSWGWGSPLLHAESEKVIRLWDGNAPGSLGSEEKDIPTLTLFLPAPGEANGTALIICPGGGYSQLAGHEGASYANYFIKQGITCFVLKYRLATNGYHHPSMWQDATRAIRLVRANAGKWQINPNRIGIIGSSAGGHLASTVLTHFDAGKPDDSDPVETVSSRPDFGILCYAVISMTDASSHAGSRSNLLGENYDPTMAKFLSSEKQVTAQTPPCFVWCTAEDATVPAENSLLFAEALNKNHVPYDLHIYEKGSHGIGLASGREGVPANDVHPWAKDVLYWMRQNGWMTTPTANP